MKIILIVLLLVFVVAGIFYFQFNKHRVQDSMWEKSNYPYLDEIHNSRTFRVPGYEFTKLSNQDLGLRSRAFLYPEEDWNSEEISTNPHFWVEQSRLFVHKEKKIFAMGLTYEDAWVFFDANGTLIEDLADEDKPNDNYLLWEMIYNSQKYYRFDNKEADIYVSYFAKDRYNWSRHNPLANMGSTTGGHGSYWWWFGNAFMKIQLEKEVFVFKTDGQMVGIDSKAPDYKVLIDYYKIPKEFTNGKEVVLIYQDKSFDNMDYGLYMIREK